jgi:hypothetical protein
LPAGSGRAIAFALRGMGNDVYTQISVAVMTELASKNAILIVAATSSGEGGFEMSSL